jgi:hypothetical protein
MTRMVRSFLMIGIAILLLPIITGLVSAASVPLITGLSPSSGPVTGGTVATISGLNLTGTTGVMFGTQPGTGITILDDTRLTVITPANPAGSVPISVTNSAGTGSSPDPSTWFLYVIPPPQLTSVTPLSGSIGGGTPVTITGSGFATTRLVQFGSQTATDLTVLDDNHITVTTPPNPVGTVAISVTNAGGVAGSPDLTSMFRYEIVYPKITGITPASGPAAGGTLITINGSGFLTTRNVRFGDTQGANLTIIDDRNLTITAPAHPAGTVPVSITNAKGTGYSEEATTMYQYDVPVPQLTGISPDSGSISGGTRVTITGTGFTGAKEVMFAGLPGTDLIIADDEHLTITTPAHPAGTVPVAITSSAGLGESPGPATMFRYEILLPKLTGIFPDNGSVNGGTVVTLTGSGFTTTKEVTFGGKAGTGLNVIDDRHLTIITPAFPPRSVPISISNAAGSGGSLGPATLYRFAFPPPVTTRVTKNPAPAGENASGTGTVTGLPVPVTPPHEAAPAAAAQGTPGTPGFEGTACLSALSALILFWKYKP